MNDYTAPEMNTERRMCGRTRAKILSDPCAYCQNRVMLWDKAACKDVGRTWWTCRDGKTQPTFVLDATTIEGNSIEST